MLSGRKNSSRTKTTAFVVVSKLVKLILVKGVSVRTKDFQINIENICRERNDSWSTNVLSRIQFVQDLHATDAVYHQKCRVNFRTGKSLPSPTPNIKKTTGRSPKHDVQIAFQKTMDYLIEHEDEQITAIELIDKMSEFCGDMAYTSVHMKSKLQGGNRDRALAPIQNLLQGRLIPM